MGKSLLLILFLTLAGCPPSTPGPSADELKREQQKRMEAERRRAQETASKTTWQTVAFITGTGALLMLIIGTALGSRARHHATRRK